MVLVDLSERCIDACRTTFGEDQSMEYHVNDGRSLTMVADSSIDLAFSFDSLVHADVDVIDSYIEQLSEKLTVDGIAYLHHSNFAAVIEQAAGLTGDQLENRHWRSESVSAEIVAASAARVGMSVVSQERINWGSETLTDCITVITPRGSRWERSPRIVDNPDFMAEALLIAKWAPLYTRAGTLDGLDSPNR
jgi:hypothetical protein